MFQALDFLPYLVLTIVISLLSFKITKHLIIQDEETSFNKSQEFNLGLVALLLTLLGSLIPVVLWQTSLLIPAWAQLCMAISFTCMLAITAVVDAVTRYIYDLLLLAFSVVHVILLFFLQVPWQDPLLGALIGGGMYLAIRVIAQLIFKKEAFGMGDVYLMSAIGLVIGSKLVLLVAFGAFYLAFFYIAIVWLLRRGRGLPEYVPFGPFMCLAAWLALIWGEEMVFLYYRVFLGL